MALLEYRSAGDSNALNAIYSTNKKFNISKVYPVLSLCCCVQRKIILVASAHAACNIEICAQRTSQHRMVFLFGTLGVPIYKIIT